MIMMWVYGRERSAGHCYEGVLDGAEAQLDDPVGRLSGTLQPRKYLPPGLYEKYPLDHFIDVETLSARQLILPSTGKFLKRSSDIRFVSQLAIHQLLP
jgi:hypothetical protein